MKKLLLLFAVLSAWTLRAQPIITVSPTITCAQGFSTYIFAGATINPSLYTHYVWTFSYTNTNSSMFVVNGSSNSSTVQIAITQASGFYTVTGTAMNGSVQVGSSSQTVLVNPQPTLTASASPSVSCAGSLVQLACFGGAMSYTWVPGNMAGPTMTVFPTVSTCYTVFGMDANGCVGAAVACASVMSLPTISISGSTYSVCKGSSADMTVSTSAANYSWSTGATNTPTVNVMPQASTMYTVFATGSNGCVNLHTVYLSVDTTCSKVWPGDANSDGVVNSSDVLEVGLAFSSTGQARNPGGNSYTGQHASNWSGTVSTGKNMCHADCDGSGTVNANDTLAISLNWNQTHAFKSGQTASDPDLYLSSFSPVMADNSWGRIDVMLGSTLNPVTDLYGVVFDLGFPSASIQADSVYILYGPSFMSANNTNLHFRKQFFNNGVVHAARVRTNQTNVSGNGKIAELHFKVKHGYHNLVFTASNAQKTDSDGTLQALSSGSVAVAVTVPSALDDHQAPELRVAPNPANDRVMVSLSGKEAATFILCDLAGRQLKSGSFEGSSVIDVSDVSAGTYLVKVETTMGIQNRRIVILR